MFTSNYNYPLLTQTIIFQLNALEAILSDYTALQELAPERIEDIENAFRVFSSVLQKINDSIVNDFEENERIYIRHAIALHLKYLTNSLLTNEITPKEDYDANCDTMHTLLSLYQFFL